MILQPDLGDLDLSYWELFMTAELMPTEQILEIGLGYFDHANLFTTDAKINEIDGAL